MTASSISKSTTYSARALHIALWAVQVLLALGFGMAGFMKATHT